MSLVMNLPYHSQLALHPVPDHPVFRDHALVVEFVGLVHLIGHGTWQQDLESNLSCSILTVTMLKTQEQHRQQTIIHPQPFNKLGVITSQLLSLLSLSCNIV